MKVVAVIATYRRLKEIERLLAALENSSYSLHALVVVDNASDEETRSAVARCLVPHCWVDAGKNLGCGGGLRFGEAVAFREFPELTHLWILDDDTVPETSTLAELLKAMETCVAGAACPQVRDARGRLNWFPGLRDRRAFASLCKSATPEDFIAREGTKPQPFLWATGVALLVAREAVERGGFHREDFWVRGEDLDFSLRITAITLGIYVPTAHLAHLPPGSGEVVDDFSERMKHAAMLQNCAFLFTRTRHGRALLRHWPGNGFRHLRRFGFSTIFDLVMALMMGAVAGWPAGVLRGDYFRRRMTRGAQR